MSPFHLVKRLQRGTNTVKAIWPRVETCKYMYISVNVPSEYLQTQQIQNKLNHGRFLLN